MCVASMISDHALKQWPYPNPVIYPTSPPGPTKEQFEELLVLLRAAKKFDELTNQPDCQDTLKKSQLKRIATQLGLDARDL